MFIFCITLSTLSGVFFGVLIANERAARQLTDELRVAEVRAFKRGEAAAWREATQRLRAAS